MRIAVFLFFRHDLVTLFYNGFALLAVDTDFHRIITLGRNRPHLLAPLPLLLPQLQPQLLLQLLFNLVRALLYLDLGCGRVARRHHRLEVVELLGELDGGGEDLIRIFILGVLLPIL